MFLYLSPEILLLYSKRILQACVRCIRYNIINLPGFDLLSPTCFVGVQVAVGFWASLGGSTKTWNPETETQTEAEYGIKYQ